MSAPLQLQTSLLTRDRRLLCKLAVTCADQVNSRCDAVDLICLCDRSGSMQGNKLRQLRAALNSLIDKVGAHVRVAVLTFNDSVEVVQPLEFMTPEAKEELALKLDVALERAFGSTHLYECMDQAVELLRHDELPLRQVGVVVLTDGQDSTRTFQVSNVAARLMASYETRAWHLFFLALGNDHNRQLLEALHEAGATAVYLQMEAQLTTVYQRVYSLLKRLLPYEVKLVIELHTRPAMPMPRVLTNQVPHVSDGSGDVKRLEFPLRTFAQAGESADEMAETRSVLLEWVFETEVLSELGRATVFYKSLQVEGASWESLPWKPLTCSQDPVVVSAAEREINLEEIRVETRQVAQDLVLGHSPEDLVGRVALLRRRSTEASEGDSNELAVVSTLLQELETTIQSSELESQTAQAHDFVRQLDAQRCISTPFSDRR